MINDLKFQTVFSFFPSNYKVFKAEIHKMLVRIANRDEPDQTASSKANREDSDQTSSSEAV